MYVEINICHISNETPHVKTPKTVYVFQYINGSIKVYLMKVVTVLED